MNRIKIGKDGTLVLPSAVASKLAGRELQVDSFSAEHLCLGPGDREAGIQMAGTLGDIAIVDLPSFLNMFRKSGRLRFGLAGGDKDLFFRNGEIVYAASTFPGEELGEILYGLGKFDRDLLKMARQQAGTGSTLGSLLVEQGMISNQDLWTAVRSQVETIIYHPFTFHEGHFLFVDEPIEEERVVSLSMNTQNLIMEGLRRVDERALYMQKIKSFDAVPVASGKTPNDLDSTSQRMVALIQAGTGNVAEILRRAGVGEFDGLRLLSQLVDRGVVVMEEAPTVEVEGSFSEVITIFNGVLTAMYKVVSKRNPHFLEEVNRFLVDLPQPFSYVFRQVSLKADGSLDGGRILANLAGLEEGDKLRLLTEALSELVYMECVAARRELGAADSADLIKRVQEVSQRVQTLTGRQKHG